jgi:serine/threonine-protein kinase SRPK3
MSLITETSISDEFVEKECNEPSSREITGNPFIYLPRQLEISDEPGHPVLCDFDDAQFGKKTLIGEVMPDIYRGPKIIVGIPWDEKIDIWSVGLMVSLLRIVSDLRPFT